MNRVIDEFTREEYELLYSAFKSYRVYMTPDEEVLSEKILDDLFYVPLIDKLSTDDDFENDCFDEIVKDAEEALASESEINGIKSLNFRS